MATIRSEFRIGLKDETRAGVASVTRSLDSLATKAAAAGIAIGGIGVGVVTAGLAATTKQVIDLGADLEDLAFATGQTVEQLSFLDYAAKLSGTSVGAISSAAQRLSKNLVEVAKGGGKQATDALELLGLAAGDLLELDLISQLSTIGEALQAIENPSQRAAAGAALFGKQFKELAPLLLQGERGLAAFADRFVELGGVITTEQAAKFATFNDSIDNLRLAVTGAGKAIADTFTPALTALAEGVATNLVRIGPFFTDTFFAINETLLDASRAVQKSKLDFLEFFNVFGVADSSVESTRQRIAQITEEIELLRDARDGAILSAAEERRKARESLSAPIPGEVDIQNEAVEKERQKQRLEAEKELAREQRERFRIYSSSVDETMRQVEEEAREWEELDRRRKAAADAGRTDLQRDLDTLREINELLGSNSQAYGEAAIDAFDRATGALVNLDDKAKETERTFAELGATFTSAFEDAILNGEKFSDVLGGLAKDIARLLLRNTVTDPLAEYASNIFKTGTGGGGIGGGIGDFFRGLFSNANGGLYRVAGSGGGERPVAFTAQPGEFVSVSRGTPGGGEIQVINIGAAPQRVERRQVNGKRQVMQFFSSTAADATSEGALLGLGIAPPLVAR